MTYIIDYSRAYNAHSNTSFSPERRAKSEQAEFKRIVAETRSELEEFAVTEEQKEILDAEMERFEKGLYDKTNALLDAKSRTASSMITGGGNFPVERNRKRMATVDNRRNDYLNFIEKATNGIKKKIIKATPKEVIEDQQAERAMKIAKAIILNVHEIKYGDMRGYSKALITKSTRGRLETIAKNGGTKAVEAALEHIKENQDPKNKVFAANNGIWKMIDRYKEIESKKQAAASSGPQVVERYDGAIIEKHFQDDRVRIFFDEKPNEAIRKDLKGSGWRFSPRANNAWQRKITNNAIYSAQSILNKHFEKEVQNEK